MLCQAHGKAPSRFAKMKKSSTRCITDHVDIMAARNLLVTGGP